MLENPAGIVLNVICGDFFRGCVPAEFSVFKLLKIKQPDRSHAKTLWKFICGDFSGSRVSAGFSDFRLLNLKLLYGNPDV